MTWLNNSHFVPYEFFVFFVARGFWVLVVPWCPWATEKMYSSLLKTESLYWIIQFWSSDWLSHHGIWAILPCSPHMVTVRAFSKLKTNWKSVVFPKKVGKNTRYFVGVFNKTIIPLALVGYEMIIANSALHLSLAIYHLLSNAHSWNNS